MSDRREGDRGPEDEARREADASRRAFDSSARRVLIVVPDLFFATKIAATAEALGVALDAASLATALERCRLSPPDLVLLDLHAPGEPLDLARALGADPATRGIPIVGFYSHVDQARRRASLDAGIAHVLPRSAFSAQLAAILSGALPARGGG